MSQEVMNGDPLGAWPCVVGKIPRYRGIERDATVAYEGQNERCGELLGQRADEKARVGGVREAAVAVGHSEARGVVAVSARTDSRRTVKRSVLVTSL
jgi:hypothetical protein